MQSAEPPPRGPAPYTYRRQYAFAEASAKGRAGLGDNKAHDGSRERGLTREAALTLRSGFGLLTNLALSSSAEAQRGWEACGFEYNEYNEYNACG